MSASVDTKIIQFKSKTTENPIYPITTRDAIIDENVTVEKGARVGKENDEHKIAVLGREVVVGEGATVEAGEIVDKNVRG